MPFDPTVFIIFSTLFLSLIASLLYAFWYQTFKYKYKTSKGKAQKEAESIGVSELKSLIQASVRDALGPLDERLASLEEEVQDMHAVLGKEEKGLLPKAEDHLRLPSGS